MIHALQLFGKVLFRQLPPRALWWGIAKKYNYLVSAGDGRYGFELLYLEHPDPWNYLGSAYERDKYCHALACMLKWRKGSGCVLEVGCSIGVFSKMLAAHFDEVTAMDVSREALRAAADYNLSSNNIRFVHGDLRSIEFDRQYDAIICAEMLYSIPERDGEKVCRQLNSCLAADGVLVTVMPLSNNGWDQILSRRFSLDCRETVQSVSRPFEVVKFSRLHPSL